MLFFQTGQTLLHVACGFGQIDIVLYLLQKPDFDFQIQETVLLFCFLFVIFLVSIQVYGHSPLHVACLYEQQRIVPELLRLTSSCPNFIDLKDNASVDTLCFNQVTQLISPNSPAGLLFIMLPEMGI